MSPRTRDTASAWLVKGTKPASKAKGQRKGSAKDTISDVPATKAKPATDGSVGEARHWLPSSEIQPKGKPSGGRGRSNGSGASSSRLEKAQVALAEQHAENAELGKRVKELQTELQTQAKQSETERSERDKLFEAREAELKKRIDELEVELAGARKRRAAKTRTRRSSSTGTGSRKQRTGSQPKPKASAGRSRSRSSAPTNGQLDLNAATFEELRGLGLSVTQSARMIAYRDVRGGYKELTELDEIPGLSEKTRGELKRKLHLGG